MSSADDFEFVLIKNPYSNTGHYSRMAQKKFKINLNCAEKTATGLESCVLCKVLISAGDQILESGSFVAHASHKE